MHELLRPPAHRGPLIAAGAVVLSVGVVLQQVRTDVGPGVHLAVAVALAVPLLWLAAVAELEGGRPPSYASVLIVLGLGALYLAMLRLADTADAFEEGFPSGWLFATGLVEAGAAAWFAVRRGSAIAALAAAVAAGVALLSLWELLFEPDSVTPYRWLLLGLAVAYGLASLPLRGMSDRHSVQMVNAAGLAVLAISAVTDSFLFGGVELGFGWMLVLLAGGFGLIAYAAADRVAGPAYLGVLCLGAFVLASIDEDGLLGWPLFLIVVGLLMLAFGLRPRDPLPPEPSSYTAGDVPISVRVRRD